MGDFALKSSVTTLPLTRTWGHDRKRTKKQASKLTSPTSEGNGAVALLWRTLLRMGRCLYAFCCVIAVCVWSCVEHDHLYEQILSATFLHVSWRSRHRWDRSARMCGSFRVLVVFLTHPRVRTRSAHTGFD